MESKILKIKIIKNNKINKKIKNQKVLQNLPNIKIEIFKINIIQIVLLMIALMMRLQNPIQIVVMMTNKIYERLTDLSFNNTTKYVANAQYQNKHDNGK